MSTGTPATEESGADPSMEDILASIRRILNEDEAAPGTAASPAAEGAATARPAAAHASSAVTPPPQAVTAGGSAGDEDDVLVLDEAMLVTPAEPPAAPPAAPPANPAPEPRAAVQPPTLPIAYAAPELPDLLHDGGLLAPASAAAATSSVSTLLRTLSSERTTQVHRGGPTIEDLVREELRPLVKAWLDEHLPPLVERLVRQEIERVAGRAGL